VAVGFTVTVPPEYGSVYELPSDPVTLQDAALPVLTVRTSDCPAEMVLYCAVIVIVGPAASALGVNAAIPNNDRMSMGKGSVFTGACLSAW
jgi:hypothetical protein